jgi:5'(3')-deoxyribonucleotidase
MICYLDLDGVLVDFVGGCCRVHDLPNPYLKKSSLGNFRIDKLWGLGAGQFWEPLNHEFWATLGWTEDGQEILEAVEELFDDVYILTSPSSNPEASSGKMEWVLKNIPNYTRRTILTGNKFLLAQKNRLLVDDHDKNIVLFEKYNGKAIQVPRPWNALNHKNTLDWVLERLTDDFAS